MSVNSLSPLSWGLNIRKFMAQASLDPAVCDYVKYIESDGGEPMSEAQILNMNRFVRLCQNNGAWEKLQFAINPAWGRKGLAVVERAYCLKYVNRSTQTNTTTRRPAWLATGMNSRPAYLFDGSDDIMASPQAGGVFRNVPSTTVMAIGQVISGTGRRLVFYSTGLSGGVQRVVVDQINTPAWRTGGRRADNNPTVIQVMAAPNTVPCLLTTQLDYQAGTLRFWSNRTVYSENLAWQNTGNTSDTDSQTKNIGADTSNSFSGYCGPVLFFAPMLTVLQQLQIEDFFASAETGWGINLT